MSLSNFTCGLSMLEWIDIRANSILTVDRMEGGSMSRAFALSLAREDWFTGLKMEQTKGETDANADSFSEAFEDFCSSFE